AALSVSLVQTRSDGRAADDLRQRAQELPRYHHRDADADADRDSHPYAHANCDAAHQHSYRHPALEHPDSHLADNDADRDGADKHTDTNGQPNIDAHGLSGDSDADGNDDRH